jgi:signal transduction histidine kinase
MFSSLRTRLWLSYALLIIVLLAIVAVGLVFALLQTPRLIYPDIVFRMRAFSETVPTDVQQALSAAPNRAERYLQRESSARDLRLVLIGADRKVITDTGGADIPFNRILRTDQLRPMTTNQIRTIRQRGGGAGVWLYMLQHLTDGSILLIMASTPVFPLAALLRDQFFSPFLYAGLAALGLAFLLAFLMGNWISAPLRRMVSAAQAVARGEHAALPVEGPGETQELASAMNEMSQRVQLSQQSQRDFVANVSHELKTPLTSIQGFAQAILDGAAPTPEALQQAAAVIFNEATRMNRLVMDLLSLARLEAGTADLQRAPVNMKLLLGSVAEKFIPQAQAAQVDLRTELEDAPILIGDGDRLAQVFTNLIDNAIKFTPPGGSVTLAAQQVDGGMLIRVADTGKGIAPDDLARIFERFYQVDKSRRGGTGRGVGLGLAIARQIVLAHSGKIWVESQPGQGSHFMVKLPLARADDSTLSTKLKGKR